MSEEIGEVMSVRSGSWSGAKAREGSPEDLRDPICVHAQGKPDQGQPAQQKSPAREGLRTFRERQGEHEETEIAWAAEANQ